MKTRCWAVLLSALLVVFLVTIPSGCGTQQKSATGDTAVKSTEKAEPVATSEPKADAPPTASGVFLGKSGSPMIGARLLLCSVQENRDSLRGTVKLLDDVPVATTDKTGRFEFKGVAPGRYTIAYLPAGVKVAVPNEMTVSALDAIDKSIAPLLRNAELGTNKPYEARRWGPLTLLKGHTFWSLGTEMKIWNATARYGQQGPFLEVRRGSLWMQQMPSKTEMKFDAWSF